MSLSTLTIASRVETDCQQLASLYRLTFDALMDLARDYYSTPEDRQFLQDKFTSFFYDGINKSMEHKLAELVYYRKGSVLAADGRFNEMTRLQLEHECLVRGVLTRQQMASESSFYLQVNLRHERSQLEQAERALVAAATAQRPPKPDSGYGTGNTSEPSSDDSDSSSDDGDDPEHGKEAIYVKVWRPQLGSYITYRY